MTQILQWIGWFLLKIYEFFESAHIPGAYALALVVFTIIVKLVLFPLSYKGKKSMMQMNLLQGKMKQLEQQYSNNRQKYQEEVAKLYEKEHVSPMSGCLWSMLPLPILMALYYIIRRPLLYMMSIPKDTITEIIDAISAAGYTLPSQAAYQEIKVASLLQNSDVLTLLQSKFPDYASNFHPISFNLFGIDLSETPTPMFWKNFDSIGIWPSIGLFLIPLAVTALNFWYTRYSQKTNAALTATKAEQDAAKSKKKKKNDKPAEKSAVERQSQTMMWMMPLMYLWFGFIMPAGMCIYMAVNAVLTVVQDAICVKILRKSFLKLQAEQAARDEQEKAELAARKAEIAERRREQEEAAKKGKKGKKPAAAKAPAKTTNKNGRIGIRAYALGRDYDPDRFGGVTPYRDPQEIIDEQAVEAALTKKRRRKADAVEKAMGEAVEAGDLDAVKRLEAEQAALEEAEEEAAEAAEAAAEEELPADDTPSVEEETPSDEA